MNPKKSLTNKAKSKINENEFIYETEIESAENKSFETFCKLSKNESERINLTIQYTSIKSPTMLGILKFI